MRTNKVLLATLILSVSTTLLWAQNNPRPPGNRPTNNVQRPNPSGGAPRPGYGASSSGSTQTGRPQSGGYQPREQSQRPSMPLIEILDANKDRVIDAQEITGASAALKKLDKNNDGKLTPDEFAGPRPGGAGGPPAGGSGGQPPSNGGQQQRQRPKSE